MRTGYAILPADHPQATANQLERAIAAIEGDSSSETAATVLRGMMEDADAAFSAVSFHFLDGPHFTRAPALCSATYVTPCWTSCRYF